MGGARPQPLAGCGVRARGARPGAGPAGADARGRGALAAAPAVHLPPRHPRRRAHGVDRRRAAGRRARPAVEEDRSGRSQDQAGTASDRRRAHDACPGAADGIGAAPLDRHAPLPPAHDGSAGARDREAGAAHDPRGARAHRSGHRAAHADSGSDDERADGACRLGDAGDQHERDARHAGSGGDRHDEERQADPEPAGSAAGAGQRAGALRQPVRHDHAGDDDRADEGAVAESGPGERGPVRNDADRADRPAQPRLRLRLERRLQLRLGWRLGLQLGLGRQEDGDNDRSDRLRTPRVTPPAPSAVQERAPRLVLRFTLVTVACLGIGAAAILGFVRHTDTKQAERAAATRAQLAVDGLFLNALEPGDLRGTLPAARQSALSIALAPMLSDGTLVTASHRGRIFWSSDPSRVGRSDAAAVVESAREETLRSEVTPLGGRRFLRSVVPVRFQGANVAVSVYQDDAPIARQAHDAFLPVAGVLELILFALFVLLVPLLARVSRRIARQMERIRFQALHDDLTGLPNRVRFRAGVAEAAELAAAGELAFAVLLMDIDRFKEVNDALGHGVGDELLVEMGERIQASVPEGALVARLGGDEFAIVIIDTDAEEATAAADWVRAAIAEPFTVAGLPVAVEASVGVVLCPGDGDDVDTLMRRADIAMYGAKERRLGRARYQPEFETTTPERVALMAELGRALDNGELVLWYQPQAGLQRGDI